MLICVYIYLDICQPYMVCIWEEVWVKKHLKIVSTGSWHETENGKEIHRECVREPLTKKRLLKTKEWDWT